MGSPKGNPRTVRYPPEFKLKVVRTALEKKLTPAEVAQVYGIGQSTWYHWKTAFEQGGEEALRRMRQRSVDGSKPPPGGAQEKLREDVLAAKRQFPFFGAERLWHWVRRTMFLPVSRGLVRRTLKQEGTGLPPATKN